MRTIDTFWRIRDTVLSIIMDIDELCKQLTTEEARPVETVEKSGVEIKRERLKAIVAGGLGERFLGRALSIEQLNKMPASEVEKLYTCYEIFLGASMSKDVGHAVILMLSDLAAYIRTQIDASALATDLEANPNIAHDLCVYSGGLYNKFGGLLTPISALLILFKHCKFGWVNSDVGIHATNTSGDARGNDEGEKPNESGSRPQIGGETEG